MTAICFGGIDSANISHKAVAAFAEYHRATCVRQREINQAGTVEPPVAYGPGERRVVHRTDLVRHSV